MKKIFLFFCLVTCVFMCASCAVVGLNPLTDEVVCVEGNRDYSIINKDSGKEVIVSEEENVKKDTGESGNNDTPKKEDYTLINDLHNMPSSELVTVYGRVIAKYTDGLFITDDTGFMLVELNGENNYKYNDVLSIKGVPVKVNDNWRFDSNAEITYLENVQNHNSYHMETMNGNDVMNYLEKENFLPGLCIEISGNLSFDGTNYKLAIPECDGNVIIMECVETIMNGINTLSAFNTKNVLIYGFFASKNVEESSLYVIPTYIYLTDIEPTPVLTIEEVLNLEEPKEIKIGNASVELVSELYMIINDGTASIKVLFDQEMDYKVGDVLTITGKPIKVSGTYLFEYGNYTIE